MNMRRWLRREDLVEALRVAPGLIAVWALLPLLGIRRLRPGPANPGGHIDQQRIERRALALRRIGARLPQCRCLPQSLALARWLHRRRQPHQLKIGVAGTRERLRVHAWVEIDGRPVNDSPEVIAEFREVAEI